MLLLYSKSLQLHHYPFSEFPDSESYLIISFDLYCNASETKPKKLLDQVREALRTRHYSYRTEQTYMDWIKRYILFRAKRHPKDMGIEEIQTYHSHLAAEKNVAASTQN
jgi:Phage integrase, N-terminal SAM-like domain